MSHLTHNILVTDSSDLDTVPSGCLIQLSVQPISLPPGDPDHVPRGQPDPRLVSAGRVAADTAALGQGEPVATVAADNLDTDNIDNVIEIIYTPQ